MIAYIIREIFMKSAVFSRKRVRDSDSKGRRYAMHAFLSKNASEWRKLCRTQRNMTES